MNLLSFSTRCFFTSGFSISFGRCLVEIIYLMYMFQNIVNSYISALSEDTEQPDLERAVSSGWPASLHLIGKVW